MKKTRDSKDRMPKNILKALRGVNINGLREHLERRVKNSVFGPEIEPHQEEYFSRVNSLLIDLGIDPRKYSLSFEAKISVVLTPTDKAPKNDSERVEILTTS